MALFGSDLAKLWRKARRGGKGKKDRGPVAASTLRSTADAGGGVAFYAAKSTNRPRFIYRRLAHALDGAAGAPERAAALAAFRDEAEKSGGRGEGLKLRWCLPHFVRERLRDEELAGLEPWLAGRRAKRARMRDAFPDCADEFSVSPAFLDTVFDVEQRPEITRSTRIFTLGSCFARNIAVYLQANGYRAEAFFQTEDLNSPFSNARMLGVAAADARTRDGFVRGWIDALYPGESPTERTARRDEAIARLAGLAANVAAAETVIVTIGGALDFFLARDNPLAALNGGASPDGEVAPKFLLLADTEAADKRANLTQSLKAQGATFRLATFAESKAAIARLYAAVRALNPDALCIFTLSPVPMDSAIGLQKAAPGGAAEIDCVSKSMLRAALHEAMADWLATDDAVRYFPSYEIVRWIAPNLPGRAFGVEDASARHVSEDVLNGVYGYFLEKFGASEARAAAE